MFKRIGATLAAHGLGFDDVFKCTVFLADMSDWPAFNAIYAGHFTKGRYPTRSAMGVNGLALGARVEMECWAWNPQ
jgi:enamine deaminase RidA (YjgF/YER057c/UK114 family)